MKETEKSKAPKIRFAGFTDDWEQRKLNELTSYQSSSYSSRQFSETGFEGEFPVFDANKEIARINEYAQDVRYISIIKDGAGIGRTELKPAKTSIIGTMGYILSNESDINFVYSLMKNIKWTKFQNGSTIPHVYYKDYGNEKFYVPKIDEQTKIGQTFNYLDHLITLHQRQLDSLKKVKKSFLQKLFPKNGAVKPEIRFAGFTDDWEQRKLKRIYKKIHNAFVGTATPYYVPRGENSHFYLESNNVKNGQINRDTEVFINQSFYDQQKNKLLKTGDLVMVQSGHVGHTAVIPKEMNNTAAHALIMFQEPRTLVNPYFLNMEFQTTRVKNQIEVITTGNTIKHILASEMQKFELIVSCKEEQDKISELFRNLDKLITLRQRKLDTLKKMKKALLQQMFI